MKKRGVSFEDDNGKWSEDHSEDGTDVDEEEEGERDNGDGGGDTDTPAIKSVIKTSTKKSTMNPDSTSLYSKIDRLEVNAGMLKTNEKFNNKSIEDLAVQIHQLAVQVNGSMEFPPEDEIDIIMRYGSVQN